MAADEWTGRRFVADFRVVATSGGDAFLAKADGDAQWAVDIAELERLVELGILTVVDESTNRSES